MVSHLDVYYRYIQKEDIRIVWIIDTFLMGGVTWCGGYSSAYRGIKYNMLRQIVVTIVCNQDTFYRQSAFLQIRLRSFRCHVTRCHIGLCSLTGGADIPVVCHSLTTDDRKCVSRTVTKHTKTSFALSFCPFLPINPLLSHSSDRKLLCGWTQSVDQ